MSHAPIGEQALHCFTFAIGNSQESEPMPMAAHAGERSPQAKAINRATNSLLGNSHSGTMVFKPAHHPPFKLPWFRTGRAAVASFRGFP